jgi:hypothetical protein
MQLGMTFDETFLCIGGIVFCSMLAISPGLITERLSAIILIGVYASLYWAWTGTPNNYSE